MMKIKESLAASIDSIDSKPAMYPPQIDKEKEEMRHVINELHTELSFLQQ